jgi:hypothetical protein
MQQSRTWDLKPCNILHPFCTFVLCCGDSHCRLRIFSKECSISIELNAALLKLIEFALLRDQSCTSVLLLSRLRALFSLTLVHPRSELVI